MNSGSVGGGLYTIVWSIRTLSLSTTEKVSNSHPVQLHNAILQLIRVDRTSSACSLQSFGPSWTHPMAALVRLGAGQAHEHSWPNCQMGSACLCSLPPKGYRLWIRRYWIKWIMSRRTAVPWTFSSQSTPPSSGKHYRISAHNAPSTNNR